jgi:hypothetical protein
LALSPAEAILLTFDRSFARKASKMGYTRINDPAASCGVFTDDSTQQAAGYVSRKESRTFESSANPQQVTNPLLAEKSKGSSGKSVD